MLINEAGVVRAIKRAYKGGGYTVNSQGGVMAIYTQSWYIQARREVMPRKVLATIVEHAGMITLLLPRYDSSVLHKGGCVL